MTRETDELGGHVDQLLTDLSSTVEPAVFERVEQLVRAVTELYGAGLARVVTRLTLEPGGHRRVQHLAADDLIGGLLVLHDLHPDDAGTRIRRALDGVRPRLGLLPGDVEYLGVDGDRVARLRLSTTGGGCGSSATAVQAAVEQAVLAAAPDVVRVEVAIPPAEPRLLQIQSRPPPGQSAGAVRTGRRQA
jgi:Fe-S cluster biogenesis protein NfuA